MRDFSQSLGNQATLGHGHEGSIAQFLTGYLRVSQSVEFVGVKPKRQFLPLSNLNEPVKSGEAILVTRWI